MGDKVLRDRKLEPKKQRDIGENRMSSKQVPQSESCLRQDHWLLLEVLVGDRLDRAGWQVPDGGEISAFRNSSLKPP